jgi:hypothetical protein
MLRRLLVVLLVAGLSSVLAVAFVWAIEGNRASAQEPGWNCPEDFHWERTSGQCCVQDYDTIPDHARLGYTGNSICDEGYEGVYEQRPTKDGGGVAGCPNYKSFAFLKRCGAPYGVRPGGTAAVLDRPSEALYGGGTEPSPADLATVGGIVGGGVLVTVAGVAIRVGRAPLSAMPAVAKLYQKRLAELAKLKEAWHKRIADSIRAEPAYQEALREQRRWENLLSFYRYQYWKRVPFIGLFMAGSGTAFALSLGKSGIVVKIIGGIAGGWVSELTGGPSYPYEARDWIDKIKAKVEEARARTDRLRDERQRAFDAEWSASSAYHSAEKEVERLRTWR